MTFGPETATQDVQEFLKLASIADTFRLVVRFPWIIVIVGAVVFRRRRPSERLCRMP